MYSSALTDLLDMPQLLGCLCNAAVTTVLGLLHALS